MKLAGAAQAHLASPGHGPTHAGISSVVLLQSQFLLTDSKGSLDPWPGVPSAFPALVLVPVCAALALHAPKTGSEEVHQEGEKMDSPKPGLYL